MMEEGPSSEKPTPVPEAAVRLAEAEMQQALRRNFLGIGLQVGPAPNQFLEKLAPQNITQLLDSVEKSDIRRHASHRLFVISVLVAVLLLCVIFLWADQAQSLKEILQLLLSFAAGVAGGYGYASRPR